MENIFVALLIACHGLGLALALVRNRISGRFPFHLDRS